MLKKPLLVLALVCSAAAWADARPALTVQGSWAVEVAQPDPVHGVAWQTEARGAYQGGAFVQFKAYPVLQAKGCVARKDTTGVCKRLRLQVAKPADKAGSFAIQFPGRTQRVTGAIGDPKIEILLEEISTDDYGAMALQAVVEGASASAFGAISLRTYDEDPPPAAAVALTADGQTLRDGAQVAEGWYFLFFGTATEVGVTEDPTDLLSLCLFKPNGDQECADADTYRMSLRIRDKGTYLFVAWNKWMRVAVSTLQGV